MLTQKWTLICAPDGGGCTHAPCIPVLSLNAAALITRGPWLLDPASANRDWKELAPHATLPFKYYPGQKSRGILKLISKRRHSDLLVITVHVIHQHPYVSIIPRPAGPYTKIINFPRGLSFFFAPGRQPRPRHDQHDKIFFPFFRFLCVTVCIRVKPPRPPKVTLGQIESPKARQGHLKPDRIT